MQKAKAGTMTRLVHPERVRGREQSRPTPAGKTYSSIYRRVRKWRCNRTAKWRSLIIRGHESFLWKKNPVSLFCFWIRDCRKSLGGELASVSDFRDTLKASEVGYGWRSLASGQITIILRQITAGECVCPTLLPIPCAYAIISGTTTHLFSEFILRPSI